MNAPGPSRLSLMKHIPQLRHGLLRPLSALADEYGDVVRIPFPGALMFLVRSPEAARVILQDNEKLYKRSYHELKRFLGEGLITTEGAVWRQQRRMIAPLFHRKVITGFLNVMIEESRKMAESWRSRADASGHVEIDAEEEMLQTTLRMVTRCLLSNDLSDQTRVVTDSVTAMSEHIAFRLRSFVTLPFDWPTPGSKRFYRALSELDEVVEELVARRREQSADGMAESERKGADLLDLLLAARDPETGAGMSDRAIRDQLVTFILAGHETTAHLLTWTLELLARHPDETHRLREELRSRPIREFADLDGLNVLDQVYRESLRLYPPVWYIEREAVATHQLAGFEIPAGARVAVCPYLIHRNPKHWSDPDQFIPSRFAADQSEGSGKEKNLAWIPYGGGARSCIGQAMAEIQFQTIISEVVRSFSFEHREKASEVHPLITLRPRHRIRLRMKLREGAEK